MNDLRDSLYEYLTMRRALGFKLREEVRLLPRFIDFIEQEDGTFVTTDLALRWATEPCHVTQAHQAARLRMVRLFATGIALFLHFGARDILDPLHCSRHLR